MEKKQLKYQDSIDFLESLVNIPGPNHSKNEAEIDRSFFIKRIKDFLKLLHNPEQKIKYIHIAGTSGKSSLTYMLQSILNEAGLKTGAYFSPHTTDIIERIKVNGQYILPSEFAELVDEIKPELSACAGNSRYGAPSYFEALVAMAFLYFKKKKCEYVVMETGCGGTFDATNVIPRTEVAIITNIGLDHTHLLGDTKMKIARNKAGIIKNNCLFITGEKNRKILKIFKDVCRKKNSRFRQIDFDFRILKNNLSGTEFEYKNNIYKTKNPGEHQVKNAILAIEAAESIKGKKISPAIIKKGLAKAFSPCRLETIQKNPTIILDGAHNPDKMKTTADFLKNIKFKKLHLLLGLAEDKKLYNTLKYVLPLADEIYITRFLSPMRKSKNLKKMRIMAEKLSKKNTSIKIF
ncbi:MAG: Mur ligase family protein, partial [Patescibacteria group bacterium]